MEGSVKRYGWRDMSLRKDEREKKVDNGERKKQEKKDGGKEGWHRKGK